LDTGPARDKIGRGVRRLLRRTEKLKRGGGRTKTDNLRWPSKVPFCLSTSREGKVILEGEKKGSSGRPNTKNARVSRPNKTNVALWAEKGGGKELLEEREQDKNLLGETTESEKAKRYSMVRL